jgi:uncharacterized membrane protein
MSCWSFEALSRFRIIFLISLILNAFLGAAVLTIWLKAPILSAPRPFDRLAARSAISEEYRDAVDQIWSNGRGQLLGTVGQAMRKRQSFIDRLSRDDGPLDAALFAEAHANILENMGAVGKTVMNVFSSIASELPAEERKRYFQAGFANSDNTWRPFKSLHLDELD